MNDAIDTIDADSRKREEKKEEEDERERREREREERGEKRGREGFDILKGGFVDVNSCDVSLMTEKSRMKGREWRCVPIQWFVHQASPCLNEYVPNPSFIHNF